MRLCSRDHQAITTLDDWKVLGKPASPTHWKPGRSAFELASDWIDGDAARRVESLVRVGFSMDDVALECGVVEKRTQFDRFHRGPRNHDLLLKASSPLGPIVIGVEGKADEPFSEPLWRWRLQALADSPDSDAPERLDAMTAAFFGTTIDKDSGHPGLGCLGYQLLSALAGTLADAKVHGANRALVLVQEYVTDLTSDELHAVNSQGLEDFLTRLFGAVERLDIPGGWITAPRPVRGHSDRALETTLVAIAKLVTDRRGSASARDPG